MEQILYKVYSQYLKEQYGCKVYKLPINLPITCPNRLHGKPGCIFCAEVGTGFEARDNMETVTQQLKMNKEHIQRKYHAQKFIAYFQNYTNTFLPIDTFKAYIKEAAVFPDIVELSISTRPDCITVEQLDYLKQIEATYHLNINIELGLQTVNYRTLDAIERGHGLGAYIRSVLLIASYGFTICTHVILNLPWDDFRDIVELADVLSALPITIIKVHSLYVPKNTKLSSEYKNGTISICSKEEYFHRLEYFLNHIRSDLVIERLFSRIPEEDSEFCNWSSSWWSLKDEFEHLMKTNGSYQGKDYIPANERAFKER